MRWSWGAPSHYFPAGAALGKGSWQLCLRSRTALATALSLEEPILATRLSAGAGLDTRPWRLVLGHDVNWFEVDQEDMVSFKHHCMERAGMRATAPACNAGKLFTLGLRQLPGMLLSHVGCNAIWAVNLLACTCIGLADSVCLGLCPGAYLI